MNVNEQQNRSEERERMSWVRNGTEYVKSINHTYVYESKRDCTDKEDGNRDRREKSRVDAYMRCNSFVDES